MNHSYERPVRDFRRAFMRGFMSRCPHCGQGRLFRAFLKVADECPSCHERLHHHRADDAPAYFVILIVGHIVVPMALWVERVYSPSDLVHTALWLPLASALSLALLQPIKGALVGLQWANFMHGFDRKHTHEAELDSSAVPLARPRR
jgi:uncharacterized protein (DUF983 family)